MKMETNDQGTCAGGASRPGAEPPDMLIRQHLAQEIARILQRRHLTQQLASDLLRLPQPTISALLRGQLRGISQARLIACLNRLGRDVEVVVRRAGRGGEGRTMVRTA